MYVYVRVYITYIYIIYVHIIYILRTHTHIYTYRNVLFIRMYKPKRCFVDFCLDNDDDDDDDDDYCSRRHDGGGGGNKSCVELIFSYTYTIILQPLLLLCSFYFFIFGVFSTIRASDVGNALFV